MAGLGTSLLEKVALFGTLVTKISAWATGPAVGPTSIVDFGGGLQVKTIARLVAAVDDAVQYGVAGPVPWLAPVPWATGLVCVATPPATVVTYQGEAYVTTTAHTAGGAFDAAKFQKIAAKGADGGTTLTTKGDLLTYNGTTVARVPASAGKVPFYNADSANGIEATDLLRQHIRGLAWSKSGANTIDITAGGCLSDDGTHWIEYAGGSGLAIDTALGTGTGTLDTGVISNAGFYVFLQKDPATGTVKPVTSLNRTAPSITAGYKKRLIGYIERASGSLSDFWTAELAGGAIEMGWKQPAAGYSGTVTTARTLATLKVPAGIEVQAKIAYTLSDASNSVNARIMYPGETDVAVPASSPANLQGNIAGTLVARGSMEVRTNASGQVAHRGDGNATLAISTTSFKWDRR